MLIAPADSSPLWRGDTSQGRGDTSQATRSDAATDHRIPIPREFEADGLSAQARGDGVGERDRVRRDQHLRLLCRVRDQIRERGHEIGARLLRG